MQNKQFEMSELYGVILEVIESGGEFRLFPRGTSMRPLLREGRDSVLLKKADTVKKYDICLYRRSDGSFVLHRVMKVASDGTLVFCGDNQTALERGVPREAVIARVGALYREEKRVSLSSLFYRLYVFLHSIMPLRRVAFLLRRIKARLFGRKK